VSNPGQYQYSKTEKAKKGSSNSAVTSKSGVVEMLFEAHPIIRNARAAPIKISQIPVIVNIKKDVIAVP